MTFNRNIVSPPYGYNKATGDNNILDRLFHSEKFHGIGSGQAGWYCDNGICLFSATNGMYLTKDACEQHCKSTTSTAGYICDNYNCKWVNSGATYPNLSICQTNCQYQTPLPYSCTPDGCKNVGSGGQYATLEACQSNCARAYGGYNCVNGQCVQNLSTGYGEFATLEACQNICSIKHTGGSRGYNCVNGQCQYVNQNAQYSDLATCQTNCITNTTPPPTNNSFWEKYKWYIIGAVIIIVAFLMFGRK